MLHILLPRGRWLCVSPSAPAAPLHACGLWCPLCVLLLDWTVILSACICLCFWHLPNTINLMKCSPEASYVHLLMCRSGLPVRKKSPSPGLPQERASFRFYSHWYITWPFEIITYISRVFLISLWRRKKSRLAHKYWTNFKILHPSDWDHLLAWFSAAVPLRIFPLIHFKS